MRMPRRIKAQTGRHAQVDGIPFELPINSANTPALMAGFRIDHERARELLPGNELHPLRLLRSGVLLVTVVDYRTTDIGKYIEFSIAIGCTHGPRPAPPLLPALLQGPFGVGQYVYDLPVSTEISVKGGKGIWGMPKHQANLDFTITDTEVASQYDLDGQLAMRIEIDRPRFDRIPISTGAVNYCAFRGMLMKSFIYFKGRAGFTLMRKGSARLYLGDHPRVQPLKDLRIDPDPIFTAFIADSRGVLDDHYEGWFLSYDEPPKEHPEGLESVADLGLSEEWLPPPSAPYRDGLVTGDGIR